MGLWYKQFPDYMVENISKCYAYDLGYIDKENHRNWEVEDIYPNLLKFQFISDTGNSWHAVYRDLRERGWNRLKVQREGGRLQYLMRNVKVDMPEGYSQLTLLLDISIATCKQVQVGTKMVEQPIYETKCDDLVDLNDTEAEPPPAYAEAFVKEGSCDCSVDSDRTSQGGPDVGIHTPDCAEVIPLVVIDDIEELQRRRSGGYDPASDEAVDPKRFEDNIPF